MLVSFLLAAATAMATDVSGDWEFAAKILGDTSYVRITLKVDGNKLTGSLNELRFDGTIDGDKLTFAATRPNGEAFGTFEGVVHGDEISGTALWHKTDKVEWTAKRRGHHSLFPVYAPGALLFIGDGHAAQGDGELTGDALETSMQVEFTVGLIKGQSTQGPRAENADYLMAMGIGNSLEDALRIATTQLVNWLQKDYKLEPNEAAIVLGTSMRYDVAEVVDPLVHIVAKVRKDALAGLK
jgi:hypothetical protein